MEKLKGFYLIRQPPYNDGEQNLIVPLKKNEMLIGRHVIPNKLISRQHALFKREEDTWTIKNLSLNGVQVNNDWLPKEEQREVKVGDIIQFGQPAMYIYKFGMKLIPNKAAASTSCPSPCKKVKSEEDRNSVLKDHLSQEHAVLEQQLRDSDIIQERLQKERDELNMTLQKQKSALEEKYKREREALEKQHSVGTMAQQVMLEEKETLAQQLQHQVMELQNRLEEKHKMLQENVRKEEEQRSRILQEKETVLRRLEDEKARLEQLMQEERCRLEAQLHVTEGDKEQLKRQVEAKECEIKEREEQQMRAEEERQKLKEMLEQERKQLQTELLEIKTVLSEKEKSNSDLNTELKQKEEELNEKLAGVVAEMEKNTAVQREEVMNQLRQVQEEKERLEEQLIFAQAQDQAQLNDLQESLQTVEAQKISLEQELQSTNVASEHARREVLDTVSDVVENEFQCPICNELFISAVMLNCSHTFCSYCIDMWKKNKKDCPNCRQRITSETRSLVVDNFIEKIVPTLSLEMKEKRADIVKERKEEMAAAAARQVEAAAAAAAQRGRRGRGRARSGRGGRQTQQPGNVSNAPDVEGLIRHQIGNIRVIAGPLPNMGHVNSISQSYPMPAFHLMHQSGPLQHHGPSGSANARGHRIPGWLQTHRMTGNGSQVGQPIVIPRPSPRRPLPGRRGHWANGCPDGGWY